MFPTRIPRPAPARRWAPVLLWLTGGCLPVDGGTATQLDTAALSSEDHDLDGHTIFVDCDDADPDVYPGATETCDGVDEDCDGLTDEDAVDAPLWYADTDRDGWGASGASVRACTAPPGHVAEAGDCDDLDARRAPTLAEQCNGRDDDCDGVVDEGC